jgi:hypothetical protein
MVAGIAVSPVAGGATIDERSAPLRGLPGVGFGMPGGGGSVVGVIVLFGLAIAFVGMAAGLGRRFG